MPLAAVTSGGRLRVVVGSTIASTGRSEGWLMPALRCSRNMSTTQMVVDSDPVPAVVGMAMRGLSGSHGVLPSPMGGVTKSSSSPGCVVSRLTALAVSIEEPPPTAM